MLKQLCPEWEIVQAKDGPDAIAKVETLEIDGEVWITVEVPSGVSGMRLPYLSRSGTHNFTWPDLRYGFDGSQYALNQIAWFFATNGREILDDPCLGATAELCPFF